MMDRQTVDRFAHLAITEPKEKRYDGALEGLSDEERELFEDLRQKSFRLEQERIPMEYIQKRVSALLSCDRVHKHNNLTYF